MGMNHFFSTINWLSALYINNESGVLSDQVYKMIDSVSNIDKKWTEFRPIDCWESLNF